MNQRFPLQPIYTDKHGAARFRENKIVQYLLKHGGIDLNELSIALDRDEFREDWEQFAQLIGYSLSGFSELDYVSDDAYNVALAIARNPEQTPEQARIEHLEGVLSLVRQHIREAAAQLFRIHPDDLHE